VIVVEHLRFEREIQRAHCLEDGRVIVVEHPTLVEESRRVRCLAAGDLGPERDLPVEAAARREVVLVTALRLPAAQPGSLAGRESQPIVLATVLLVRRQLAVGAPEEDQRVGKSCQIGHFLGATAVRATDSRQL
jgi:hypothetical protein